VETFLYFAGGLMVLATAIPLVRADAWWVRIFDFPRLQITFLAAVVLITYAAFFATFSFASIIFVALLGASLFYQAVMMYPYTRLASVQVENSVMADESTCISLLVSNVLEKNRNSDGLLQIVGRADPDIILAVETNERWKRELDVLLDSHPNYIGHPQENTYGMVMYSRLELIEPRVKFLLADDIPSIHTGVRLHGGAEVQLRCLHPRPPVPSEDDSTTDRDAEILIVGRENKASPRPFIVMGDLNDVAWSRTNYLFQNISGLLDPRVGRGFYHTFHANLPLLRFPLDHFFHSNHFRLVDFRRLGRFGSDHFPVCIKLSYEPDAVQTQEELQATPDEISEADEKVREGVLNSES
jgi:endonuclease/exonuclease/phosphatase (EEP) superfamily protein YafD